MRPTKIRYQIRRRDRDDEAEIEGLNLEILAHYQASLDSINEQIAELVEDDEDGDHLEFNSCIEIIQESITYHLESLKEDIADEPDVRFKELYSKFTEALLRTPARRRPKNDF